MQRRRVRAHPDQAHRAATQVRDPRPPPAGSWICWVNGPHRSTGQPCPRISRAVAVIPAYSCALMCSSYHGPSRSPGGCPAADRVAATNEPYIVSLSSSAGTGRRRASSSPATVLFPAPGGPATTHAGPGRQARPSWWTWWCPGDTQAVGGRQPGYRRPVQFEAVAVGQFRQPARHLGGSGRRRSPPRPAKYPSKPAGEMISSSRAGWSVAFQKACGTPRGLTSTPPGPTSTVWSPICAPTWPSSTTEYSSSRRCVCIGEPSDLGCSGCSTSDRLPAVRSPPSIRIAPSGPCSSVVRSAGVITYPLSPGMARLLSLGRASGPAALACPRTVSPDVRLLRPRLLRPARDLVRPGYRRGSTAGSSGPTASTMRRRSRPLPAGGRAADPGVRDGATGARLRAWPRTTTRTWDAFEPGRS